MLNTPEEIKLEDLPGLVVRKINDKQYNVSFNKLKGEEIPRMAMTAIVAAAKNEKLRPAVSGELAKLLPGTLKELGIRSNADELVETQRKLIAELEAEVRRLKGQG